MTRNTLIVRSTNILKPPLLVTDEAMAVEVYDASHELVAVMHRVLEGNYWAMTTRNDPDWNEALLQLGYIPGSAELDIRLKRGFLLDGGNHDIGKIPGQ